MDEVDGRPGHVALQSGHTNAHCGVPTDLLSLPPANLLTRYPREAGANLLFLSYNPPFGNSPSFTGEAK
jgi:hypothetical protein